MPLSAEERETARQLLVDSLAALKRSVAELSPAQLSYSCNGGWSPLGILAHLYVVETGIMRRIPNSPPPDTLRTDRDTRLLKILRDRSHRMEAPERVIPDGRFSDPEELLQKLDRAREISLTWLLDLNVDPRAHAMEHPFLKTLDGYQWLLTIAGHMERHIAQIEQIKASPEFPAS